MLYTFLYFAIKNNKIKAQPFTVGLLNYLTILNVLVIGDDI